MCGIFGVIGRNLADPAIETVLALLHHRGPDGSGTFEDETAQVTFAHTRLKVLDLATGAQPMLSEDGNIVMVANGEIYDFERIRSSLEARGCRFKSKSDSEVIIYLYREFGLDCFEQLRGEFAFLLYDKAKRLVIAARDRFGIKPLYFSSLPHGFVFASEMKAIFGSGLVAPKLNVAALDPLLNDDPENAQFPFEGVRHVPPGCYATIDLDTYALQIRRYWSGEIPALTAEPIGEPFGEAQEAAAKSVLGELDEAVRLRLRADVPVGLYLSGGLDSSFVGALMRRNVSSELHSFSISFVGSDRNEQEFTRRAAEILQTTHHELPVTKQMLWEHVEQCLWFTELPFVTLAPVGTFLLSEEARKAVTVVLNGQGADEVFLGYRRFFEDAIRDTRSGRADGGARAVRLRRLKLTGSAVHVIEKLSLLMFQKSLRRPLAAARARGAARPRPSKPAINFAQETRIAEMPLDILAYLGDRVEMAHSLEVRLPFLDHKLYDMAKHIPVDLKLHDGVEKAILRDAATGILPDDLRLRRKLGFMLTSQPVDLFGEDREATEKLRARHLSKDAFERSQVFSYRACLVLSLLAKMPAWKWLPALRRMRRSSNKLLMYMMQTHMLHDMFVAAPRWATSGVEPVEGRPERTLEVAA